MGPATKFFIVRCTNCITKYAFSSVSLHFSLIQPSILSFFLFLGRGYLFSCICKAKVTYWHSLCFIWPSQCFVKKLSQLLKFGRFHVKTKISSYCWKIWDCNTEWASSLALNGAFGAQALPDLPASTRPLLSPAVLPAEACRHLG